MLGSCPPSVHRGRVEKESSLTIDFSAGLTPRWLRRKLRRAQILATLMNPVGLFLLHCYCESIKAESYTHMN